MPDASPKKSCISCFEEIEAAAIKCPHCQSKQTPVTAVDLVGKYKDSIALLFSSVALITSLWNPMMDVVSPLLRLDGARLSFEPLNPEFFNIGTDDRTFSEKADAVKRVVPVVRLLVTNSGRSPAGIGSDVRCYLQTGCNRKDLYLDTVDLVSQKKTYASVDSKNTVVLELALTSSQDHDDSAEPFRNGLCDIGYTDKYGPHAYELELSEEAILVLSH